MASTCFSLSPLSKSSVRVGSSLPSSSTLTAHASPSSLSESFSQRGLNPVSLSNIILEISLETFLMALSTV